MKDFALFAAVVPLSLVVLILYLRENKLRDTPHFAGDDVKRVLLRTRIKCPAPGPGTLVIVGLGQSNAGNWGEPIGSSPSAHPDVFEFWQGNCYRASSPMLGATGNNASLWPTLGQSLIEKGIANQVVFQVFSVDGASIGRFVARNDLWPLWRKQLRLLVGQFPVNYYMWLQGEADFSRGTTSRNYKMFFDDLHRSIREIDQSALVYVPVQSYCADIELWKPINEISAAQKAIPAATEGVLPGVDSDAILSIAGARWDGCHPSQRGYEIWAQAWASRIAKERGKSFGRSQPQ